MWQKLTLDFNRYFPKDVAKYNWMRNPFDTNVEG
jgi:hypothetical protein